ncbi:MAG: hypothetical protein KGL39_44585, partial [Patescibacteria group bacterium]|nr:hypothetical protein [Patescibacteria group bacterium]
IRASEEHAIGQRKTYWVNQSVNTPPQGSAHQWMVVALALIQRFPKRYRLLRRMRMEVHDSLVPTVKLRDMVACVRQGEKLLSVDTERAVRKDFGVKMTVPMKAEAKAGFRLGVAIKVADSMTDDREALCEWLALWCQADAQSNARLKKEMHAAKGV